MDQNSAKQYYLLVKNIGHLLTLQRLYKDEHPILKEKLQQVFAAVTQAIANKQPLVFSESKGVCLVNGEAIEIHETLTRRFLEQLRELKIGSISLEPGLTIEDFTVFIHLLSQSERLVGEDQIKGYLKQKGVERVIPLFASYKLVREDEKVVKDTGELINIKEIPAELINRFSRDLKAKAVGEKIKTEEKLYQLLAHDPSFISTYVSDAADATEAPAELPTVLWSIGDYLINEISTVRQEELNRKILKDVEERLLKAWEKKERTTHTKEDVAKTFTAINAALELRGLTLLYKKHEKGLRTVTRKIKGILDALPADSQIYKKTMEDLGPAFGR